MKSKNIDHTAPNSSKWLMMTQPRLGTGGLVTMLILANVLVPLSLDIYTPTLPELPEYFQTSEVLVNFTIMGFFLFFAVGLLVFGPISDRVGRRPILIVGFVLYTAGSALCACSPTIYVLIIARVIQALGTGAVGSASTALLKDCFLPEKRGTILTIIQVLTVIGPVFAPLLGGVIILFAPWQAIFWILTIVGVLFLVTSILFAETLPPEKRLRTKLSQSFNGLVRVMRQRSFMILLASVSCCCIPMMAYIEVGSYIYVDLFGESQQVYTYFFAGSAGISVLGPVLLLRFGKRISLWKAGYVLLGACGVAGIVTILIGDSSVWIFWFLTIILAAATAALRPFSTNVLLDITHEDVGSASSLINFLGNGFGMIGMILIMVPFSNYIVRFGILLVGAMIVSLILWGIVYKRLAVPKETASE